MLFTMVHMHPVADHWAHWSLDGFQVSEYHCTCSEGGGDGRSHAGVVCQSFVVCLEARFQDYLVEIIFVRYCHGDGFGVGLNKFKLVY